MVGYVPGGTRHGPRMVIVWLSLSACFFAFALYSALRWNLGIGLTISVLSAACLIIAGSV